MLIFVVLIFFLCWGPRLVLNILQKSTLDQYDYTLYTLRIIFYLLSLTHSAINPFIYGFMSSNFRKMMCSCSSNNNANSLSCTINTPSGTFNSANNQNNIIGCLRNSMYNTGSDLQIDQDKSLINTTYNSVSNDFLISLPPSNNYRSSQDLEFNFKVIVHGNDCSKNRINNLDSKSL